MPQKNVACRILPLVLLLLAGPCLAATPEAAFSNRNSNKALSLVLKAIDGAKESIHLAAFSFTSKDISRALVRAARRGVAVRVVADKELNTKRYTAVTYLANQKIPVRLNGDYASMHHKFMVVDKRHVQTGSFNYSKAAASKNAENVLVLWNAPDQAAQYLREWKELWDRGETYSGKY